MISLAGMLHRVLNQEDREGQTSAVFLVRVRFPALATPYRHNYGL